MYRLHDFLETLDSHNIHVKKQKLRRPLVCPGETYLTGSRQIRKNMALEVSKVDNDEPGFKQEW